MEAVGRGSHRQELAGSERGENCDEDLDGFVISNAFELMRLTSLGNAPIPMVVSIKLSICISAKEQRKTKRQSHRSQIDQGRIETLYFHRPGSDFRVAGFMQIRKAMG